MEKRQEESLIWLDWAKELQFIAQAGLTYSKDPFDLERFQRIREISAEIVSRQTGLSFERVTDLFCGETGFQTPKLDTRAAIFQDGKILLVEERDGTWSLPGGWVDVLFARYTKVVHRIKVFRVSVVCLQWACPKREGKKIRFVNSNGRLGDVGL